MAYHILIYTTFGTQDNAKAVAQALISQRLVACANILPAIQSLYYWDGAVQKDQEYSVLFKTQKDLFEAVEEKIKALHDYDVPCIVALPIEKAHKPFADWITQETRP